MLYFYKSLLAEVSDSLKEIEINWTNANFDILTRIFSSGFTAESKTAFTRCRHILKTVKNSTDRPPVHTKTAHFLPADFENGRF